MLVSNRGRTCDITDVTVARKGRVDMREQSKGVVKHLSTPTGSIQPAQISAAQSVWDPADDDCIPSLIAC